MIAGPRRLPRDLGDGFVLRPMLSSDAPELCARIVEWFGESIGRPDEAAGIWAADLLRGDHPTTRVDDGIVIVDTAKQQIVASCFYIRQTWLYDGVPFLVGRPELVATDPAYRGRGLIASAMHAQHEHGVAQGDLVNALTGIPVFYRSFGYEPALIERGSPWANASELPDTEIDGAGITIRPAGEADLPFITRMYTQATAGIGIVAHRDEPVWRHELLIRTPESDYSHDIAIIERDGVEVGLCASVRELRGGELALTVCEIANGVSWFEASPVVLRHLRRTGEAASVRDGQPFTRVSVDWPVPHPLVSISPKLFSGRGKAFVWYVRIGDLAAFVRQVEPVLERRLADSAYAGFSGRLAISFYTDGLEMTFEHGRLAGAQNLSKLNFRQADLALPGRTIVALVLGSRSLDELDHAYPFECRVNSDSARAVLDVLFPPRTAAVWPIA